MIPPLKRGATLPQPDWPGIETERLILRQWRAGDIAANTAMLGDPLSARFITPDRQARHRDDGRLAQRRDHGGALGAARLRHVRGRGEGERQIRRPRRSVLSAGLAGFRGWLGHRRRNFAARAMRSKRRGRRSTGRLRPSSWTRSSIASMPRTSARRPWRGGSAPSTKVRRCCSVTPSISGSRIAVRGADSYVTSKFAIAAPAASP